MAIIAEYIWIDGSVPTQKLRSKTKIIHGLESEDAVKLADFPGWTFDGSSTNQAQGKSSDCLLEPVRFVYDPIRGGDSYLVLCEVLSADGAPHSSNERAKLRAILDQGANRTESWLGFEQEYTLYRGSRPLGFPSERRFPAAQGPYYCGVGADEVYGRELVELHLVGCCIVWVKKRAFRQRSTPNQSLGTGMALACTQTFPLTRCVPSVAGIISLMASRPLASESTNILQHMALDMRCD
jgi:glutamine synthetase